MLPCWRGARLIWIVRPQSGIVSLNAKVLGNDKISRRELIMDHSAAGYQRQRAVRLLMVMAALVMTRGVARAQITSSAMLTAGQTGRIDSKGASACREL